MKFKIFLLSFLMLFVNNSCKQDDLLEEQNQENIKGNFFGLIKSKNAALGLGRGYDVTEQYADRNSLRSSIIQLDGLIGLLNSKKIVDDGIATNQKTEQIVYSSDASLFSESLGKSTNISAGIGVKVFGFKASITSSFTDRTNSLNQISSKHVYSEYYSTISSKTLRFKNSDPNLLKKYLTNSFKQAIRVSSPEAIVKSYGTHLLLSLVAGAKFSIKFSSNTQTEIKSDKREQIAKVGAIIGYKKFVKVEGSYTYTTGEETLFKDEKKDIEFFIKTTGGDNTLRLTKNIASEDIPQLDIDQYDRWLKTANNPKFFEIVGLNNTSFIPIYELVDNPTKKAALKAYIEKYLTDNGVNLFYELPVPVNFYSHFNNYGTNGINYYDSYLTNSSNPPTNFRNSGKVFKVFEVKQLNTVPIYEFFDGNIHYFSQSGDYLPSGSFSYQRETFHAYKNLNDAEGLVPVYQYRFVDSPYNGTGYKYATSNNDGRFVQEDIAFYAYPPSAN